MVNKQNKLIIFFTIFIIIIYLTWVLSSSYSVKNMESFNKYYSKGLTEFNEGIFNNYNAEYNYDMWSFYYDEGYYSDSIEYCVAARDLYSSANSNHQNAISYFEEAERVAKEKYKELLYNYKEASDFAIDLNWAMYEACEYFESASNFYSDSLWDSGDLELEIGNEKIILHDSLIKDYNKYISKIEVLEEQI